MISVTVYMVSLLIDDPDLECHRSWNAPEFDEPLSICTVPLDLRFAFQYRIADGCMVMVNVLNITVGLLFCLKLHQLVTLSPADSPESAKHTKFESMIIKISILTLTGCVSTTLGFILYHTLKMKIFWHL